MLPGTFNSYAYGFYRVLVLDDIRQLDAAGAWRQRGRQSTASMNWSFEKPSSIDGKFVVTAMRIRPSSIRDNVMPTLLGLKAANETVRQMIPSIAQATGGV